MSNTNCEQCVRQRAKLAVFGKLRHLQHHADLQAARHLQGQSRVAWLGEALAESAYQPSTLSIVERKKTKLVIQESSHSLRHLNHKHTGLNIVVEQLIPAAGQTRRAKEVVLDQNSNGKCSELEENALCIP